MLNSTWTALITPFRLHTRGDLAIAALDIVIVYYVVYRTLRLLRGTRAAQMLLGLLLVGAGIFAAKQFELTTVSWVLDHFLSFSIIFIIVIFQHDIRRALMRMGQGLWWTSRTYERTTVFEEVIRAAEHMAHLRVGALIVIERDADLVDHLTEPGVEVGAKVTEELLVSIFLPDAENKLHDGAVIIKELRIAQAGAVLPLSANARLDKALGTRHRAAIGVTEETDAVSVVVSEERGSISLCFGGNVARDLDGATLRKALLGLFQKDKKTDRQKDRTGRRTQTGSVRTRADDVVGADDPGRQRRLDWAVLMRRAYAIDVLRCPRCAGPMRLAAVIQDERVARRILEHLGLPARAPPRGRPWRSGVQAQLSLDEPHRFDGIDATYPS